MRNLLFSIGHSNHHINYFLRLLNNYKIKVLIDVRSVPFSSYNKQFNMPALRDELRKHNIKYKWEKKLGGRTFNKGYARIALKRFLKLSDKYNIALMCSEGNYKNCHRHFMIEPIINELGGKLYHITRDGFLILDGVGEIDIQDNKDVLRL